MSLVRLSVAITHHYLTCHSLRRIPGCLNYNVSQSDYSGSGVFGEDAFDENMLVRFRMGRSIFEGRNLNYGKVRR